MVNRLLGNDNLQGINTKTGRIDFDWIKNNRPSWSQVVDLDLSTARSKVKFEVVGTFLGVRELTSGGSLEISLNDPAGKTYLFDSEQQIEMPFYEIYVTNSAQSGVTCKLDVIIAGRYIPYYRTKAVAPTVTDASIGKVTVTATATLIIASSSLRRQGVIINKSLADRVEIGKNNSVTYGTGIPIYEDNERFFGEPFYTGDIYGICDTGKSAEVRYWFNTE